MSWPAAVLVLAMSRTQDRLKPGHQTALDALCSVRCPAFRRSGPKELLVGQAGSLPHAGLSVSGWLVAGEHLRVIIREPDHQSVNMKRIAFTLLWAIAFMAGAAIAEFTLFTVLNQLGHGEWGRSTGGLMAAWSFVFFIMPVLGLILGLRGLLPGTRLPNAGGTQHA